MRTLLALLLLSSVCHAQALPDTAKAVIVDKAGNEYRSQTGNALTPIKEPLSTMLVFSAKKSVHGSKPTSVRWTVWPPAYDEQKWVPGDGQEFSLSTGKDPVLLTIILSVALGDTSDHTIIMIQCGEGSLPPPIVIPVPPTPAPPNPTPVPPQPPIPPVPPLPTPSKISVLIIEDPDARASVPAAQLDAMFSGNISAYLNSHCKVSLGNQPEWRRWGNKTKDTDVLRDTPTMQKAWSIFRGIQPEPQLPYILISNGVSGTREPFPINETATLELLKKWGGP